jgi:hypothetical protein
MGQMPPALPHGKFEEVFPDVFVITGMMKAVLMNTDWQFSRNMTVVREGNALTLINAIRLDDAGLEQLEALGRVANVVRIGSLHDRDYAFYPARYGAIFWAMPTMHENDPTPDKQLAPGGEMPFAGCSVFTFRTSKLPEGILHIDRAGGILVACDSLQNWLAPDEFFSNDSSKMMRELGFFQAANFGPLWMKVNEPQAQDFVRLFELPFQHVLAAHGSPFWSTTRDTAKEAYRATFHRVFGV